MCRFWEFFFILCLFLQNSPLLFERNPPRTRPSRAPLSPLSSLSLSVCVCPCLLHGPRDLRVERSQPLLDGGYGVGVVGGSGDGAAAPRSNRRSCSCSSSAARPGSRQLRRQRGLEARINCRGGDSSSRGEGARDQGGRGAIRPLLRRRRRLPLRALLSGERGSRSRRGRLPLGLLTRLVDAAAAAVALLRGQGRRRGLGGGGAGGGARGHLRGGRERRDAKAKEREREEKKSEATTALRLTELLIGSLLTRKKQSLFSLPPRPPPPLSLYHPLTT